MNQSVFTKSRLTKVFASQANSPYLIEGDSAQTWTYQQVLTTALQLVDDWRARGAAEQDKIAFFLDNSVEYAVCYLSVILGKFIAVPINTGLTTSDIGYILNQARPKVIIGTDGFFSLHRQIIEKSVCISVSVLRAFVRKEAGSPKGPEKALLDLDPALSVSIHYTSGTTGTPKGVVHSLGSLLDSASAFNRAVGITNENRVFHHLPMSYMAGFLNTLLCPLIAGGSIVVQRVFGPALALQYWAVAAKHEVNTLWLVPSMAVLLLRLDRRAQGHSFYRGMIRLACIGTAPVPPCLWTEFKERYGLDLKESYGLSETLFVSTNSPLSAQKKASVGKLLSNVSVRIVDEEGHVLGPNQTGRVEIKTAFLMKGYFLGEAPAQPQTWFDSGDLGHLDEEGFLFITGRKKDLIIRGGVNVSPRALEEGFLEHPWVDQAAVVGIPHEVKGEQIFVLIKPKISPLPDSWSETLASYAREKFASHCQPDQMLLVEEFPIGVSGKILKNQLREELTKRYVTKNR